MSWSKATRLHVQDVIMQQLGVPYKIGSADPDTGKWIVRGKPSISNEHPDSFDCSGLSRWGIAQGIENGKSIILPHGSFNQINFCKPLGAEEPQLFDLGFADFDDKKGVPDHVIIIINYYEVIEARGEPYNKVILRPIAVWEKSPGFMGWWRVPSIYGD